LSNTKVKSTPNLASRMTCEVRISHMITCEIQKYSKPDTSIIQ